MKIYARDASVSSSENSSLFDSADFTGNTSNYSGTDAVWIVWVLLTAILAPLLIGGILSLLYYYHKTRTPTPPSQDYMQKQDPLVVSFPSHHTIIAPLHNPAPFITDTKSTFIGSCHRNPQSPNLSIQKPQTPKRYLHETPLRSHGSEESFLRKALRTKDSPFRASTSSLRGQKDSLELEAISSCNHSMKESRATVDPESLIDFYTRHVRNDSGSTRTARPSHQLMRNTFGESEMLMATEYARDDKRNMSLSEFSA